VICPHSAYEHACRIPAQPDDEQGDAIAGGGELPRLTRVLTDRLDEVALAPSGGSDSPGSAWWWGRILLQGSIWGFAVFDGSAPAGLHGGSATAVLDRSAGIQLDRATSPITGVRRRRDPGTAAGCAPPPGRRSTVIVADRAILSGRRSGPPRRLWALRIVRRSALLREGAEIADDLGQNTEELVLRLAAPHQRVRQRPYAGDRQVGDVRPYPIAVMWAGKRVTISAMLVRVMASSASCTNGPRSIGRRPADALLIRAARPRRRQGGRGPGPRPELGGHGRPRGQRVRCRAHPGTVQGLGVVGG
jgi:hypothetical protein